MPRPRLASARPMAGVFVLFLVLATVDPVPDPRLEPAAVEGQAFLGPAHRLADIERLRQHLGIAYWLVWCRFVGVTPGLAYAWAGAELHLVRAGHGGGADMLTASWTRRNRFAPWA